MTRLLNTLAHDTSPETIRASIAEAKERLERSLDRMITIQAEAYPSDWPDADRREMAEIHLFGALKS